MGGKASCRGLVLSQVEKRWIEFFRDPTVWWDKRSKDKAGTGHFVHATSRETLCIGSCPQWVQEKLPCLQVPQTGNRARYKSTACREQKTVSEFVAALKQCSKTRDLKGGKKLHLSAAIGGFHTDKYVAAALITMYSKCRSMPLARHVFDEMIHRDVVTWNCLIRGYVENGENSLSLNLFASMDCEPDCFTYAAALKACVGLAGEKGKQACLERGTVIHKQIKDRGFDSDKVLASTLVDLYSKCGCMPLAREVFERIARPDVVMWNCLLAGYVENGESPVAIDLFARMDCEPDSFTCVAALRACAGLASQKETERRLCLEKGIGIHKQVKERVFDSNVIVGSALVDMYSKCGSMKRAREVFNGMSRKNVVTWTSLILGYVDNGDSSEALDLFDHMDCEPDSFAYVAALKACAGLASESESARSFCLARGMDIHRQVKERGLASNTIVANTLVDMYGKCRNMQIATDVFDEMIHKSVVTWTSLLLGYLENEQGSKALDIFSRMDCQPDSFTYAAVLKACASLVDKQVRLEKVVGIHRQVKEHGFESDVVVASALVDVYSKCGSMQHAKDTFDRINRKDVVTWTCLIQGYVDNGDNLLALDLFSRVDCERDSFTYAAALKACAGLATEEDSDKQSCLEKGMDIYREVKSRGFDSDVVVASALMDVYIKCGSAQQALDLFTRMDHEPDSFTCVAALKACGILTVLAAGQWVHARVCKLGLEQNEVVATALVDLYSSCGSIATAEEMFNSMHSPDLVSWNTLIAGYASHGDTSRVLSLAKKIEESDLEMNSSSFVSILAACSHAGMVDEGRTWFKSMPKYGVSPSAEHYTCMVDMLGRSNRLDEAYAIVKSMPFKVKRITWMTLLGACRKWENVELGKVAFDALLDCGSTRDRGAAYVLMGDLYGSLNMDAERATLRG